MCRKTILYNKLSSAFHKFFDFKCLLRVSIQTFRICDPLGELEFLKYRIPLNLIACYRRAIVLAPQPVLVVLFHLAMKVSREEQ